MDISIIIPFYKGKQYLDYLLDIFDKNKKLIKEEMEVIFVNDYPEEPLFISGLHCYDIHVINNKINMGIHHSRVNGLNQAKGKYVIFLDQ
ncbi:MAG: glycosyltransferase, partial [Faecalibacillus sp.]